MGIHQDSAETQPAERAAEAAERGRPERRADMLKRVGEHILAHGVAETSLRDLSRAAGCTNRMLLYYFDSRENLLLQALVNLEPKFPRMRQISPRLVETRRPLIQRLDRAWMELGAPENLPQQRLFFQIFGLAGFEHKPEWDVMLGTLDTFMLQPLSETLMHEGLTAHTAGVVAKQIVALWRGLQIMLVSHTPRVEVERIREAGHHAVIAQVEQLLSDERDGADNLISVTEESSP